MHNPYSYTIWNRYYAGCAMVYFFCIDVESQYLLYFLFKHQNICLPAIWLCKISTINLTFHIYRQAQAVIRVVQNLLLQALCDETLRTETIEFWNSILPNSLPERVKAVLSESLYFIYTVAELVTHLISAISIRKGVLTSWASDYHNTLHVDSAKNFQNIFLSAVAH